MLHGTGPSYLNDMLKWETSPRTTRRSTKRFLKVPKTRTKFGDRAFSTSAPKLWNSLDENIRATDDVEIFKRLIKTYLYKQYF